MRAGVKRVQIRFALPLPLARPSVGLAGGPFQRSRSVQSRTPFGAIVHAQLQQEPLAHAVRRRPAELETLP